MFCIIHRKLIGIRPETNEEMDHEGHYPPNTDSHYIILLNLLNKFGKRDKMPGLLSILSLFRN